MGCRSYARDWAGMLYGGLKRFQIKGMLSCVCVYVVCRAMTGRLTYRMNFLNVAIRSPMVGDFGGEGLE